MEKMNNPLSVLNEDDLTNIQNFLNAWSGCNSCDVIGVERYLREWAVQKQPLYHMFGDNLILKKKIKIEVDCETNLTEHFTYENNVLIRDFYDYIKKNVKNKFCFTYNTDINTYAPGAYNFDGTYLFENNCHTWFDGGIFDYIFHNSLKTGVLESDFTLINISTQERKIYKKGTKIMRFFGKLAKELDIPEEIYFNYNQSYSRYFGASSTEETLVLSIHPLDYMTMSMSGMKWRSCMSWDEGEYHLGTVEMMNNAYTVVAYIEGSKIQNVNEDKYSNPCIWNTKKWRELFYVLPTTLTEVPFNFILEGKAYPKVNEDVTRECMKWLAELFNSYYSTSLDISTLSNHFYFHKCICSKEALVNKLNADYDEDFIIRDLGIEKDISLEKLYSIKKDEFPKFLNKDIVVSNVSLMLDFLAMYDDLYLCHYIIDDAEEKLGEKSKTNFDVYDIMLSGRAICAQCGEYISEDNYEPSSVLCYNCCGFVTCVDCGDRIPEDEVYSDRYGNYYCENCWRDHHIGECACCGDDIMDFNENYYYIGNDIEEVESVFCEECFENFKDYVTYDDHHGNYKFDWEKVLKDLDTSFPVNTYRKTFETWSNYRLLTAPEYRNSLKEKIKQYLNEKGNK